MKNKIAKVVAIDGPAGSGKSSVTKLVAKKLDFLYIDTGAMFRALSVYFHLHHIDFTEGEHVISALQNLKFEYAKSKGVLICINGVDYTDKIREHYVSELASKISLIPSVRMYLLDFQRQIVEDRFAVMEGRDIGTVVFPNAFCKIYLSASNEVRAQRRFKELEDKGQKNVDYEQILNDIIDRDLRDKNRDIAPLKQALDAIRVDSSHKTIEEVVDTIIEIVKNQASLNGLKL